MKLTKNIKKRITIAALAMVIGSSSVLPILNTISKAYASWNHINNMWTFTDSFGNPVTGWIKDKDVWYYLGHDGVMRTGWQKIDNKWYYLDVTSGAMKTGWFLDRDKWYYLGHDGAMVTGNMTINGINYTFDENGAMQNEGSENSTGPSEEAYLKQAIDLINTSRKNAGLPELTVNEQLTSAAQVRAVEAAQNLTHTRPNEMQYYTAVDTAGYKWENIGENLAKGATTPQSAVVAWMNSESHKENILSKDYTDIGIAVMATDGSYYIAAIFASPEKAG